METIDRNTGVIIEPIAETQYIFGSESPTIHNVNNTLRRWFGLLSKGETQVGTYYDTMACVTFSGENVAEAIFNFLIENNLISEENLLWLRENGYIGEDGRVNFSDNFNAKLSGTDPNKGNSAQNVFASFRHDGLVPESKWSWNRGRDIPQEEKFSSYFYREIPQEIIDLGKEFVKRFDLQYEAVDITDPVARNNALQHSPIQVFIPTGCPFDGGIQQVCGNAINHAITMPDDVVDNSFFALFDHYKPGVKDTQDQFIRKVVKNYGFHRWGYTCTITEKAGVDTVSPIKLLTDKLMDEAGGGKVTTTDFSLAYIAETGDDPTNEQKYSFAYYRKLWRLAHPV